MKIITNQYQLEPPYVGYFDLLDTGPSTIQVYSSEESNFSGLYDSEGNPLYKPKVRLGFL